MRIRYFLLLLLLFFTGKNLVVAQLTVTQGAGLGMTPLQLVQSRLVGQGVTISNATFNGSAAVISSNQIGSFDAVGGAYDQLGLSGGLILSSGTAVGAIGPNLSGGFTGSISNALPSDPDLNKISNLTYPDTTDDVAVLEFDFVPVADTLRFRYVFGSEEFMEFCNSYNDSFGFFLSGPGITGTFSNNSVDIAIMPNSVSLNTYVTIRNLCNDPSSMWQNPQGGIYFQYDGLSYVFTAWHIVQPCQPYHIKLAVADAKDKAYDSGVFLEENSFTASGFTVDNTFTHPLLGQVAIEGCNDATITFKLQVPTILNDTINYVIGGTATNGVDYTTIPDQVIIPAGMDSTYIVIHPFIDGITEGTETVILDIPMINCSGGTTFHDTIFILDNSTLIARVGNDTLVCQGQSVTMTSQHTGGQPNYSYLWNTGSTLSQITVTPPIGANLYYVDITDGCANVARDSIIVTVLAKPIITNINLVSVTCTGTSTNITPQSSVGGSTYSWTATCANPNISGFLPGNGQTINQVLFNIGTTTDTVIYHVTAIAAGCTSSLVKDFKVAVIPAVDAYFLPNGQSFCSGGATSISILSHLSTTTFTWTFTYGSGNLSGASNGNTNQIVQNLFNSGFTTDTVTYHITPINSGCPGTIFDVKAAVYPIPDSWSIPAAQSICGGNSTLLNLFSHVANASYTWTATCPSPNVSGYGPGVGLSIVQTLTNSGLTNEVVSYTVTPTASGCTGTSTTTILVTVKPSPVLTNATLFSVCSGGFTNIVLQSNPSPATFTWTASGSSPNVTGFSPGAGPIISQPLSNSGFNNETVNYAVTPTALGCSGNPTNVFVTVFPVADVYFTPNGQTICSGTAPSIGLNSHVAGTIYSWNASGSSGNINGFGPGVGSPIDQVLNNTGVNIETATYTVIPTANSCTGTSNTVVVSVKPLAAVSFTPCTDVITTTDANPFTLKGGLPLGGAYSGTGVNAGLFNPAIGAGIHTITYSYSNVFGCANTASLNITVLNPLPFFCGSPLTDVRDTKQYPTIKLGSQCWMAANLNFGTQVPSSSMQRDNCTTEKYCLNDISANCTTLGGLYQWDEVMQFEPVESIQGLCPPGWHIPSENDWNTLFNLYTSSGFAGSPLKYTGYSGFDVFLNGIRFDNRNWDFDTFATFLWSSTSHGPVKAWAHSMNSINPSVSFYPGNRSNAFYVRCIKN
jgi:uncharacterized protein (TIGR02145 family)